MRSRRFPGCGSRVEILECRRFLTILADRFEPNNSFAQATDFGIIGKRVENDLTIHASNDDDYYQFKPQINGVATVSIAFQNSQGDLDLLLYNSSHSIIGSSTGVSNTESISKQVTAGETYFVLVFESNSGTSPDYDMVIDSPARPAVVHQEFAFQTEHDLVFTFSKDVQDSLMPADVSVVDSASNPVPGPASVTYDSGTDTATFHFASILPDGNYVATLHGANVEDNFGNTMSSDATVSFFVMQADANHDRSVDTVDFNILAANFSQGGKTFGQGDFNYDTVVDTVDFNLLAARFGQTLPAAARAASMHQLFSDRPVDAVLDLP